MAVHSRHLLRIAVAASMAGAPARAQHAGHESMPASRADSAWTLHVMAQGVPLEVVSDVLGHSGIAITKDVYGHIMAEQKRSAADAMGQALWGA